MGFAGREVTAAAARDLWTRGSGQHQVEDLVSIPPDRMYGLKDLAVVWDLPPSIVGELTEGPPVVSAKEGERIKPLEPQAHDHFRRRGFAGKQRDQAGRWVG